MVSALRSFAICLALVCLVAAEFDPYQVLGVQRSASASDVKKQFRRVSRASHPDVAQGDDAKDRYADILRAYSVLSDPKKRSQYDQYGVLDDDKSGSRPQGNQFNFFNQRQRQKMKPIESAARTVSLADFLIDFRGYRGQKLRLLQVYSDQSPECHTFAPAWEALLRSSSIRHQAEFARMDFSDQHLVELSDLSVNQLPMLFVFADGEASPIRDVRLSSAIAPMIGAVERAVQEFLQDTVDEVRQRKVSSLDSLRRLVSTRRFAKTLVLVNSDDHHFDQVVMSLLALSDSVEVRSVTATVLAAATAECPTSSFKTTSVWVFHTHSGDICNAARFPSGRLDDEDGIMRFVGKRLAKPMPTLTNHSLAALCVDEGACVVDVRSPDNRDLPPLSEAVARESLSGFRLASCDVETAPEIARLAKVRRNGFTVLVLSEAGFATTTGDVSHVRRFVADVAAGKVHSAPLPRSWAMGTATLTNSRWRRVVRFVDTAYNATPMANVLILVVIWVILTQGHRLLFATGGGGRHTAPRRAPSPEAAAPRQAPPGRPTSNTSAPRSGTSTGGAPRSTGVPPAGGSSASRDRGASMETESPPNGGSRSYPGPGGSHETTRRSIRGLSASDVAECAGAGRVLLVLLFSPAEGIKAPADCARLLQYSDVRVRAVPRKMPRWWDWVKTAAPDALKHSNEQKTPLVVAVRVKRGMAAVKPPQRQMTMWVDGMMEGTEPLSLPVQVDWLSTAIN